MQTNTHAAERGTATDHSFSRTAAGAAALGAVFTLPVAVDAAVVYSGPQNITVTLPASLRHASNQTQTFANDSAYALLDLDGNAVPDFALVVSQGIDTSYASRGGAAFLAGLGSSGPLNVIMLADKGLLAANFSGSNYVGGDSPEGWVFGLLRAVSSCSECGLTSFGSFSNGATGVAGVRFQREGTGSNPDTTHFGWIRLLVEDGPEGFPYRAKAIEWAYESDPETLIHVPSFVTEVPEANPALALLAAGGTGLVAWRLRRRKEAKQAAQS